MTKRKEKNKMTIVKKLIITALIVLGVGAVVSVSALAAAGFDINELDRQHYVEKMEHVTDANVSKINISSSSYDVKIVPTSKAQIDISAFDGDDVKTEIKLDGNTVNISINDDRSWYDKAVGSIGRDREIIVYVPLGGAYAVSAVTESGDVEIKNGVPLASLSVKTKSGDVELDNVTAASADIQTVSGDVDFDNIKIGSVNIVTESGDVEGEMRQGANYQASTKSGRKRVPASDPAGPVFKITTKSGDIEIEFDD